MHCQYFFQLRKGAFKFIVRQAAWLIPTGLIAICLSTTNTPQNFKGLILCPWRSWKYLRQLIIFLKKSLEEINLNL